MFVLVLKLKKVSSKILTTNLVSVLFFKKSTTDNTRIRNQGLKFQMNFDHIFLLLKARFVAEQKCVSYEVTVGNPDDLKSLMLILV